MICTSGIWVVKKGREDEFARRWQEGADSLALDFPGLSFRLLRDSESRNRFLSLEEGWRNSDQVATAKSSPGFQEWTASLWRLLESGETSTLDLVAEVS